MTRRPRSQARQWAAVAGTAALACSLAACSPPPNQPTDTTQARVVAVVDGDTIKVATAAGNERVRIIGIDTPEIGRDDKASECYGDQARAYLDQLIYGRTVDLSPDPTQADRDKYGRLLRHVTLDGTNIALIELQAGMGTEYTYDAPYAGQSEYRHAQEAAQAAGIGLWGECSNPIQVSI